MCGIIGYTGTRRVVPVLLEGLRRLEYRGYDSAGLVYYADGRLVKHRSPGKLDKLAAAVDEHIGVASFCGLGHTRWATHGSPSLDNAHPHSDCTGNLVVVHNGIIENYGALRQELREGGHTFTSETDTEVLAHLIEDYLSDDLPAAVRAALARVEGSYAIGVFWAGAPQTLVAARNHSPLVLGVDADASYMASDIPALLPYTHQVIFLDDLEMAVLTPGAITYQNVSDGRPLRKQVTTIEWNAAMAEKSGFRHFMLKEIFEQPQAIINTVSGRIVPDTGQIDLPEIGLTEEALVGIERIALVACGTSWHAALVAKYWIEKWAGIPVEVDIASEFRYRRLLINERVLVIAISQSGETADTLAGIRLASALGAKVLAICNVVGSTITREADGVIYTHAGPEIGVASTKAFTSQISVLSQIAMLLAKNRGLPRQTLSAIARDLATIPEKVSAVLQLNDRIRGIAQEFRNAGNFLYLGRGSNFPTALEGALKLKEISYIHAEGYPAAEMKHGPIALIDRNMPVVFIVPKDALYDKVVSNIQEVRSRKGRVIAIANEDDDQIEGLAEFVIRVPRTYSYFGPIVNSIPLQLLAYHIAVLRGCNVDQPRNLAKSVTVE